MATRTAISLFSRANRAAISAVSVGRSLQINNIAVTTSHLYAGRNYSSEKTAPEKDIHSDTEGPGGTGATSRSAEDAIDVTKKLTKEVEALTNEIKSLKEKNDDLMDKYKRSLADSENLRVRLTKQIADAKIFGIQGFCKDLLEVADTLGHATAAVPLEKINENQHLKNLYEGLTMTKASLFQVFKRHGLEPVNPLNEKFDPNHHEALFQKDAPSVEPNTVVEVTKLGYKLHERCIRPALVGVSK